jgi:putative membrane protein
MIKSQILIFLFRWVISAVGMWATINLFGTVDAGVTGGIWLYVVAGLVFSLVNSIVRPLTTLLSLPLIIVSMGLFTLLINTGMMALTVWILPGVHIDFWGAFFGAITIAIINGLVNFLIPINPTKPAQNN